MAIKQPVTLTQVAEAAGVSIATVSRVLNRRGQVDEHTRQRVMLSVENLGYDATSIEKKREAQIRDLRVSYDVELLLCPLHEQKNMLQLDYMAEILRGVQSAFHRLGNIRMNICTWEADNIAHAEENEMIFRRLLAADGVMVIGSPEAKMIERLVEAGVNPVMVSTDRQDMSLNSVCTDDFSGGVIAARHLIARGFDRIGFLCGSDRNRSFCMRRNGVMVTALETLGPEGFATRTAATSDDVDILHCFEDWLESGDMPPAIITSHASAAGVVCRVLKRSGLRCPGDISLITFDRLCHNDFDIEITHLRTYPRDLGIKAGQRVYQLMTARKGEERPYKIMIPLELTPGASVSEPAQA